MQRGTKEGFRERNTCSVVAKGRDMTAAFCGHKNFGVNVIAIGANFSETLFSSLSNVILTQHGGILTLQCHQKWIIVVTNLGGKVNLHFVFQYALDIANCSLSIIKT